MHHDPPGAHGDGQEAARDAGVVLRGQPGGHVEPVRAGQPQDRHALAGRVAERTRQDQVAGLAHPVQERNVAGEPRIVEQRSVLRGRRPWAMQQRHPGLRAVVIAGPRNVLDVVPEHGRPALVVLGAHRGRVVEDFPPGVGQPHQCLRPGCGKGDLHLAGAVRFAAGMPPCNFSDIIPLKFFICLAATA